MVLEAIIAILGGCTLILLGIVVGYIAGRTDKDYKEWTEKN